MNLIMRAAGSSQGNARSYRRHVDKLPLF